VATEATEAAVAAAGRGRVVEEGAEEKLALLLERGEHSGALAHNRLKRRERRRDVVVDLVKHKAQVEQQRVALVLAVLQAHRIAQHRQSKRVHGDQFVRQRRLGDAVVRNGVKLLV
jgi:hypothetical protein